eukprot:Unigene6172_Nuclearia_a/m.18994 Unigene6172_Nuclearia_a/g.18994  ORF Unigene6172_Nuclearia_a/g.18994 Unigene6172_Nuclearia_a/m.18994 type:complete len:223 (-) Unigene6172_Nuclearia_a:26-694(-)
MEEDDTPRLSAAALAALAEFERERAETEAQFARLHEAAHERWRLGMKPFPEDWQLSQFWYSDETARDLAAVVCRHAVARVAFVSTPTAFVQYMASVAGNAGALQAVLLEYDRRFATYGEQFVFYDYRAPLELPERVAPGSFDFVLLDPPFLSEECLEKTARTVRHLARHDAKILACTGAVMREHAERLLGLRLCPYRPGHAHNLSNEFACYANFADETLQTL